MTSIDPTTGNVTQTSGVTPATTGSQQASSANDLANEQTFLKLLVAQLQNQDPDQPQDGTQFVAQLAQFSNLEQALQTRQDADQIVKILQNQTSSQTVATSTSSSNGAASTTSNT